MAPAHPTAHTPGSTARHEAEPCRGGADHVSTRRRRNRRIPREPSRRALGGPEALRRSLSLRLVHAWQWQPRPPVYVPVGTTQRYWAHRTLSQVSDTVRASHPALHIADEAVAESPVTALLTAAEQAEMLVLGSRGLSGVAGFLVGSVSQAVVARAPRPVVLVRAGEEASDEQFPAPDGASPDSDRDSVETPYRNVVLGLDTSSPCDELIEFAFDAAQHRGAALRVIHTFSAPPPYAAIDQLVPKPGPELLAEHEHAVSAALYPWREKFPRSLSPGPSPKAGRHPN